MERSSVLDKVKAFMKQVEEDDPAPIPLEESKDGPNVELELGLGIFQVSDPSKLKYDSIGTLVPELLDKEEASPAPIIEELSPK